MNKLGFRANSKLEKLIGRELITNNTIAFFELIKNSYDAGASRVEVEFDNFVNYEKKNNKYAIDGKVVTPNTVISTDDSRIIIKDNGIGMSFEEVKKYWMEIGTVHKENVREIAVSNILEGDYVRRLNGEKGIGRFGTDKLGAKLILNCIDSSLKENTVVEFDWNKYDDHSKLLQDIVHDFNVFRGSYEYSGITLEISQLRDEWTIQDIERLKGQFQKLISPFSQEQDMFSIDFIYHNLERIVNDSLVNSNVFIEGEISEHGRFEYTIFDKVVIENEVRSQTTPSFGPVKLKIIYMDKAAKQAFSKKNGIYSRQYGNIKLFRDNFRVFPYGEASNDWLGIDNEHAQGVFRTLASRDLIGYVQISNEKNPLLKDATNRLGLIEDTTEFEEFKEYIWKCIHLLEDYIFKRFKKKSKENIEIIEENVEETFKHTKTLKENLKDTIEKENIPKGSADKILKLLENTTTRMQKDIEGVKKANVELKKQIKIYERISGSEEMLYELLHTIMNKTAILGAQLADLEDQAEYNGLYLDSVVFNSTLKSIDSLLSSALRKASTKNLEVRRNSLKQIIEESIAETKALIESKDILIRNNMDSDYSDIKCNKESIKVVLDNLFSNSFKALRNKSSQKLILIELQRNKNYIEFYFSDNGKGILEDDAPYIFNVGYTKTNGNGMGLATTLDIVKEYKGDISLVEIEGTEYSTTFKIKFPLMEEKNG